jgi:hypothetical protein
MERWEKEREIVARIREIREQLENAVGESQARRPVRQETRARPRPAQATH